MFSRSQLLAFAGFATLTWQTANAAHGCSDSYQALASEIGDLSAFRVVLVGERHGTAQIPAFTAALVRRAALEGRPVTVAMEIPGDQQHRLQRYIKSEGGPNDVDMLTASDFWRSRVQDGRSSEAALKLMRSVKTLRASGHDVITVALDEDWGSNSDNAASPRRSTRNLTMAFRLMSEAIAAPDRLVIALVGAYHASPQTDTAQYKSETALVNYVRAGLRTLVVGFETSGGSAWVCIRPQVDIDRVRCGSHPVSAGKIVAAADRYVQIGKLSSSPPAVDYAAHSALDREQSVERETVGLEGSDQHRHAPPP
jgi:erythromycin esterase-like protein